MPTSERSTGLWARRLLTFLGRTGNRLVRPDGKHAGFRSLYERFREILSINDAALELFADMEDAVSGRTPPILDVLVERLRLSIGDAHTMVSDLAYITSRGQPELEKALGRITRLVLSELPKGNRTFGPMVMPLPQLHSSDSSLAGNKMANLAEAWRSAIGVEMPDGFVITTTAFARFMTYNGLWEKVRHLEGIYLSGGLSALERACSEVQESMRTALLPRDIVDQIMDAYDAIAGGEEVLVSLRSSAIGEDRMASHAGLYRSVLNVPRKGLTEAYRQVVESVWAPSAVAYRVRNGIPAREAIMAVGCMRMVDARCAGVLFTRDFKEPAADRLLIGATPGLAAGLVAGAVSAEETLLEGGATPVLPGGSCLSPKDANLLIRIGRLLERTLQQPQDIEWAIDRRGALFLLQVRPMRLLALNTAPSIPPLPDAPVILDGGKVACPGLGAGPVFRLTGERRLETTPEGAVLVAPHSSATIAQVMDRCAAIITEVGSPVGHMSILAREYEVPCIVELAGALERLQDGQQVTVDAHRGLVLEGALPVPPRAERRPLPPKPAETEAPAMVLRRVALLVAPLHLIDPASDRFRPENCQTLHDVTRYIHEKVFETMFHFGDLVERHGGGAPKLEARLPFTLLVYDVGGGLSVEDEETRSVRPEQVISAPMKAFLTGLLDPRIRSDQPRPVSTRGFLAVLGESMASPPPEAQQLGRTSFAVISDRYMNFSTKAGYHFSTVDTYCGNSPNKNYIHFRFSGGGASEERRSRRVQFLSQVLSHLEFDARPRGDALVAASNKYQRDVILHRLVLLGRLTMIARQLDMLMDSDSSPAYFARAFLEDRMDSF